MAHRAAPPWDDLKYVLALHRHGSAATAGRALQVNATTVSRRLQALEAHLETRLFERLRSGVAPTEAGRAVIEAAERIEAEILALDAELTGQDTALSGRLRVTAIESFYSVWAADFAEFSRQHPQVELVVRTNNLNQDLSRRQDDVAIRLTPAPPEELLGRRLAEVMFAIYAARDFAQARFEEGTSSLSEVPWVSWDEPFTENTDQVIRDVGPGAPIPLRVNSLVTLEAALEQGVGVSVLPCFVGDRNPKLVRVGSYFEGGTYVWVLTHPQLRGATRMKVLRDAVAAWAKRDEALLRGDVPLYPTVPISPG